MKKIISVLFVISVLLLCACGQNGDASVKASDAAPQQTPAAAAEPPAPTASPEPETEPAAVKLFRLPAVLCTLKRGDTVEVIGEADKGFEEYLTVKFGDKYGLVEKQFLRMEGAAEYEPWTGYTKQETGLHSTYYLNDEKPLAVPVNTELRIIDEFEGCYLAEYDGKQYTVPTEAVGKARFYAYEGDPSGDFGGAAPDIDGGDMYLGIAMHVEQSGTVSGKASVRLNGTPLILGIFERGEEVSVLKKDTKLCTLRIFGVEAETESRFIRPKDEKPYESWTGYAVSGAKLHADPWLSRGGTALTVNSALEVLEDLGDCYMVRCQKGEGFMAKPDVNREKAYVYDGGSGGGYGGSSEPWTEPAL